MKLLLLLFFSFTTPVVLFLVALLYGGVTNDNLKKSLAESGIYKKVSNNFVQTDSQAEQEYALYSNFVSQQFTPAYIQKKTELAIDDSIDWITGKTQTTPVVSFEELKQEMVTSHPELLEALQTIPSETTLQASDLSTSEQERYLEQRTQISSFVNQDFTIDLGQHLQGIKTVYGYLQIALPVLVVILLISLFMLIKLPEGAPAKFRWISATLITSSIIGYCYIYGQIFIMGLVSKIYTLEQTEFLVYVMPIVTGIYGKFVDKYVYYQGIINILFLIGGILCLITSLLVRKYTAPAVKPLKVNPRYWRETTKKSK